VDGELAESVADVLARFAPNGVTTEQAFNFMTTESEDRPLGPITVRAYLPVDGSLPATRQKLEEALTFLGMIRPLPKPVFTSVPDQDWMEAWKVHYQPIPIGRKLIIGPAWLESPEPGRIPIRIDPGMAFGTGTHPTTQLCLELVEELLDESRERKDAGKMDLPRVGRTPSVIDVGCGSGILSIAALKLGASFALGVDIDPAAVKASRENADANGIQAGQFVLGTGSVTEILGGRFGMRQAPLVLANILASVIINLFSTGLADLVTPGGALILSGILAEQADAVITAAGDHGMKRIDKRQVGDWIGLLLTK